jgi:hypothetical protein
MLTYDLPRLGEGAALSPRLDHDRCGGHRDPKPHPSCGGVPGTGLAGMSAKEVWKTIGAEDTAAYDARVKYAGN